MVTGLVTPFVPLTFILSPEGRGIFEERQRELWGNSTQFSGCNSKMIMSYFSKVEISF
jgi:hypothetical protein